MPYTRMHMHMHMHVHVHAHVWLQPGYIGLQPGCRRFQAAGVPVTKFMIRSSMNAASQRYSTSRSTSAPSSLPAISASKASVSGTCEIVGRSWGDRGETVGRPWGDRGEIVRDGRGCGGMGDGHQPHHDG